MESGKREYFLIILLQVTWSVILQQYQSSCHYRRAYTISAITKYFGWNIGQCHVIGPIFINGNLNGEIYTDLLDRRIETPIIHELVNQKDVDANLPLNQYLMLFQQDGVYLHNITPSERVVGETLYKVVNWTY